MLTIKALALVAVWLFISCAFASPHPSFRGFSSARRYARRALDYDLERRDACDGTSCPDGCYDGTNDVCCSAGGAVAAGDICCDDKAGGGCADGLTCGFCGDAGVCCSDPSCTVLVNTDGVSSTLAATDCQASAGSTQVTVPTVGTGGTTLQTLPSPTVTPVVTTPPTVTGPGATPPATPPVTPPAVSVNPSALTCGWINGNKSDPYTCQPHSTCVIDDEFSAFGCCNSKGSCDFATACVHGADPICVSRNPGDCYHFDWTIDCLGGYCISNFIPPKTTGSGGAITGTGTSTTVPGYISANCVASSDTTTVLPVFTGGPSYSQYPIEYSVYLASVSPSTAA